MSSGYRTLLIKQYSTHGYAGTKNIFSVQRRGLNGEVDAYLHLALFQRFIGKEIG